MTPYNFERALGKQVGSPEIVSLLAALNLPEQVHIGHDDSDVYLNAELLGVSLLFESDYYLNRKYGLEFEVEAPVLTAITLYGRGNSDFAEFSGHLPGNLNFADGRDGAKKKLGPSEGMDDEFNTEFWRIGHNIRLFLDYSADRCSIQLLQFGILFKEGIRA